ncbi:unnamed protein product [Lactuca saligna]|uniref:Uncharacterized protein n=1 Tax=Lactuca saligna TaxID=75948 RepID=A0AA35ZVP7_LACSI|nr:unnamed protein product [Lactuca saligna]
MMETLGCVEEGNLLYYHFKRPFSDLDFGLFTLASDSDINHLGTYVGKHKLIEVYVEHGKTVLHTYTMSSTPCKVRIEEIVDQPSCSRRLFLEWRETETGDYIGSKPGGITHESDNRNDVNDSGDSGDSDDNIEWVGDLGGSNVKEMITREIDDIEVVNNAVFLYESSSDECGSNRRKKSIKAIRRAMEIVKQELGVV